MKIILTKGLTPSQDPNLKKNASTNVSKFQKRREGDYLKGTPISKCLHFAIAI